MNILLQFRHLICVVLALFIMQLAMAETNNNRDLLSSKDKNNIVKDKIDKLLENYVLSVNECNTELAKTFWDSEGEISFIHPRGFEHNFDEIKNNFYIGTMGKLFSKRDLKLKDIKAKIYDQVAFLEFSWDFYATVKETNVPIHHKGRETQFLIMRNGEWKISNIHYSSDPKL